jgi:membrane-bound serine protease (ClpP class)
VSPEARRLEPTTERSAAVFPGQAERDNGNVTALGIALLCLAALFFIAEAHSYSGGVLGLLGLLSIAGGAAILYDQHGTAFAVTAVALTLMISVPLAVYFARKVIRAQREKPARTGWEEMIGEEAVVREPLDPVGHVFVNGALWRAQVAGNGPVAVGNRVRIESVEGLTLTVTPLGRESGEGERGE